MAGSGFQAWGGDFANSAIGIIGFSALSGGVGAELIGRDFWQGAGTGAIVGGLNHAAHMLMEEQDPPSRKIKKAPWDANGDGKLSKAEADWWYVNGNGEDIYVDNRRIDWTGLKIPKGVKFNKNFGIETHKAFTDLPYETASTYGGTSFKRIGANTVKVLNQRYHYNLRANNNFTNVIRNFLTGAGHPGLGSSYQINYLNPKIYVR